MAYRVFEVPEYYDFIDALGVGPEPVEGGETQRLEFETEDGLLVVTFDIPGQSFRCHWSQESRVVVEVFREGAIRLRVRSSGSASFITVYFETDSDSGHLEVQVSPTFALKDQLLFR